MSPQSRLKKSFWGTGKRFTPRSFFLFLLILAILGYALFEARGFLKGPSLSLISPENGVLVTEPLIEVVGSADNIRSLSINGKPIYVDREGSFSHELLVPEGYTIISVKAVDRFGREKEILREVVYRPTH